MGRGLVNVLTGWLELPKQIHLGSQEENPLTGFGWGFVKGVGMTVLRSGVGVYETVTFPLPYPKDFTSPYEHMELPDYAWE
jgi:putative exosortase-associated protein (TIGR04073 family)